MQKKLALLISKYLCQIPVIEKLETNNYELFIDVGNVGPDYQPGHAHSDTLILN